MLRYSMAKLGRSAGRKTGTVADLPAIEARLSTEKAYYAALRSMLAQMATETREGIIPLYEAEQRQKRAQRAYTGDADQSWFSRLRALTVALQRVASDTVSRILGLEAVRHTDQFMAAAKKAIGIDLRSVVQQEDLADFLREAVAQNVASITGFSDDITKRIEQTVYSNSIAGNSVTTLRKELQKQFKVLERRAELIARTETARFNSNLNRIRQTQAGVTEYVFMTSRDERVRANHKAMEGRTCKWSDPGVYKADDGSWRSRSGVGGVQLHPGQDYQCRCVSRGVVTFD